MSTPESMTFLKLSKSPKIRLASTSNPAAFLRFLSSAARWAFSR
jgi:hypothetical protein